MTRFPLLCVLSYLGTAFAANLLPDASVCGINRQTAILGEKIAQFGEFRWTALLEYDTPNGRGFYCGGSLINNRYILTAAHCINKVPPTWTLINVRLGEYDLDTEKDCDIVVPGFEDCADDPLDIGIEEKIVYEDYRPESIGQHNDIALLRLKEKVSFTDWVGPICLPTSPEFLRKNFAGTYMTVSGWGRTENSSQRNKKLKLQVPLQADSECISKYFKEANASLTDNQLCAGGIKGKDSCTGDSGGPLMYLNTTTIEDNWYAAAVVSFGPISCGLNSWPGVYTKVAPYVPWILEHLRP